MNQQALYLEAIKCDPKNSMAYSNLGTTLTAEESIQLLDGRQMDRQMLFLEAKKFQR